MSSDHQEQHSAGAVTSSNRATPSLAGQRIGLNVLYLRPGIVGGGETYARGLLDGLSQLSFDCKFIVLLNASAYPTFAELRSDTRFELVQCSSPLTPVRRHLWEQWHLGSLCKEYGLNLLHSLGNITPLLAGVPQIVTIHDLIHLRAPERLSFAKRTFARWMVPASVRVSEKVLTISEFSRRDLLEKLRVPTGKVVVSLEGPGQGFEEVADIQEVRVKYSLPRSYFLAIGTGTHKRVELTAAAVRAVRANGIDTHLVVAGHKDQTLDFLTQDGNVSFSGYVPSADLAALVMGATALVCSSEMEGFGLPVLEAMMLGTPVISSDQAALLEMIGDAGLTVKVGQVEQLTAAMIRIIEDDSLREDLKAKGKTRSQLFSWKHCAAVTLETYAEVLRQRNGQ
jgi:glycosyltransferase involved in cell wall biosynthesis